MLQVSWTRYSFEDLLVRMHPCIPKKQLVDRSFSMSQDLLGLPD